jgi:hypothetical protein
LGARQTLAETFLLLPQIQQLRAAGTVVVTQSGSTPEGSSVCNNWRGN